MKTKEQLAEEYYPNNLGVKISFCAGYDTALANIDWEKIEKEWRYDLQTSYYEHSISIFDFLKNKLK